MANGSILKCVTFLTFITATVTNSAFLLVPVKVLHIEFLHNLSAFVIYELLGLFFTTK